MESLMVSIDSHGIQVPLTVYWDGDSYRLIDGERRWRCATKLNLPKVPALIQDPPSELENLLLMYNIHALREQWDYFTIASKLTRVVELFTEQHGHKPNEVELSRQTGLARGQIRRCRLLQDLPDKFQRMLLTELELPKSQQKLSEDLFIEMETSLKAVTKRLPLYKDSIDSIRDTLVDKFRAGTIAAVTDFRQLSKIATAIDNLGVAQATARRSLDRVFDARDDLGIREAYQSTVEFQYDEHKASRSVQALNEFIKQIVESDRKPELDETFVADMRILYERLRKFFAGNE